MVNLVYFDMCSDFGFFKKPDINKTSLTYNLPPKPAILGMIGSILGMGGFDRQYETISSQFNEKNNLDLNQFPEFYERLKDLKIGIKPIGDFPFNKIINTYNSRNSYFYTNVNVKAGLASENVLIHEQLLIRPKYRIYVYDQAEKDSIVELTDRLKNNKPVFMPYLGKNEFIACFDKINTGDVKQKKKNAECISSVFLTNNENTHINGNDTASRFESNDGHTVSGLPGGFRFVENYPIGYSENMHYHLQVAQLAKRSDTSSVDLGKGNLFEIDGETIYLF